MGDKQFNRKIGQNAARARADAAANGFKKLQPATEAKRDRSKAQAHLKTVLLVEDTSDCARRIKEGLESAGFQVVVAETLEDAVRRFTELKDTLIGVVTDMYFPTRSGDEEEVCGLSLIGFVKRVRPGLPVIGQSSSNEFLKQAKKQGADSTLNKMDLLKLPKLAEKMFK